MAIIYSYPQNNNILPTDILVGTSTVIVAGKPKNQTKSFSIQNLANFISPLISIDLNDVLTIGNTSLLDAKIGKLYLHDTAVTDYGKLQLNNNAFTVTNALNNNIISSEVGTLRVWNTLGVEGIFNYAALTGGRIYNLPDNSGTIALTSDIPIVTGFVPYTGATNNVDLGMQYITSREYRFLDIPDSTYGRLFVEAGEFTFMATPTSVITRIGYGQLTLQGISTFNAAITYNTLTNNRVYALPDASGTVALISNIPVVTGFVPYTGATQAVNLGAYDLTVNSLTVGKGSGTGLSNTAVGNLALFSNTTGGYNTAIGNTALRFNTTGDYNIAVGHQTLISNTTGRVNTAVGGQALNFNTTGTENVVTGFNAMLYNTTGSYNTGIGNSAMFSNLTGNNNTAVGIGALGYNRSGSNNAALGFNAGSLPSGNIVIDNSVFLGTNTKALGNNQTNQIVIGYDATGQGSNTVTLGNTSITTTRLRGTVQGGSFVKDGGTAAQYLMADGSVTIAPYKYNFGGSVTLTGTLTTTNLLTITIPANSLTDYLDIRSIMVQQTGTVLGGMQVRMWHNSVNDFNSATRILNYAFGTGGADLFAQISRRFSLQSGLLFGFPAAGSNIAGEGSTANAALSIPFNPAVANYLFVSIQLNDVTDTAILRNVNITT